MHLLLITYEFPPYMATGGIGSYMYHLAHVLAGKGHAVTVFSATTQHAATTVLTEKAFTNYLLPADNQQLFQQAALALFRHFIQTHTVDVIESPEVGACALLIKKAYPHIPLVVKLHTPGVLITKVSNTYQSVFTKLRYVAGAFMRGKFDLGYWSATDLNKGNNPEYQICVLADALLSPSSALKKWAVAYWRLPEEKIKLLPNPIATDTELFTYPTADRGQTICFIGKLSILKGMLALTPTIKEILLRFPTYRFVLAGRDEAASEAIPSMKAWMQKQLGSVGERAVFTGALNKAQVFALLAESRVCIVPSLWENYPNVVLEAMAAGCAVAASDAGGIPELITHGKNGLLFNPKKPAAMVDALRTLLENEPLRLQLAEAGRATVHAHQYSETFANQLVAFYQQVQARM